MRMKRGALIVLFLFMVGFGSSLPGTNTYINSQITSTVDHKTIELKINKLKSCLQENNFSEAEPVFDWLNRITLSEVANDSLIFSEIDYYCGTYLLLINRHDMANQRFRNTISFRESIDMRDQIYLKAYSNLGVSMYRKGDFRSALSVYENLIKNARMHQSGFDKEELTYFVNMSASCIRLQNYEKARHVSERGLQIADSLAGKAYPDDVIMLYHHLGITYSRRNDYTTALLYLNRAWDLVRKNPSVDFYLNIGLINTLTLIHTRQGDENAARKIYLDAYPLAISSESDDAFYFIHNYATFLAQNNENQEVISLMRSELNRLAKAHGDSTRFYQDVLSRYTRLLGRYGLITGEAIKLIETKSIPFCNQNPDDLYLISDVYESYALCLMSAGRYEESLNAIQVALFPKKEERPFLFIDPDPSSFISDREGLELLQDKINILKKLYTSTGDIVHLGRAINTNRFLISAVEKVRIDIGEEESRILLGDNFSKVYDEMISDLYNMYTLTGDEEYFSMAFEYAERSKSASLLVSLREVKATEFSIPDSLIMEERSIESELGHTRELLAVERANNITDSGYVKILMNNELRLSEEKSRLTRLFEEKYPEFYSAKYNTSVASIDDVLKIAGRRGNYVNYIFTDSVIYTFIINKQHKEIVALQIDSALFGSISDFRGLLQLAVMAGGTRAAFNSYVTLGNYLYMQLFEPIEEFLISEKIIISTDNVLTYIPFEALVRTKDLREDLLYRELDFLIRDFDISYTYSATMSAETNENDRSFRNKTVAFAPEYKTPVDPENILNSRQGETGNLIDLPFARDEAAFIVSKMGGELYLKSDAEEHIYKSRAPEFSIVHLAMHTIINELSPGYSKLIFSTSPDADAEEGLLNTYEIYNTPLSAKMVVVSSCNTGIGELRSGEGVMSLARGFINAGSRSVVMSLWEVNDELGTEVVKSFYLNLLKGQRKSEALRNAKLQFIDSKGSNQFRGNPFYWATLVVYGNNGPVFHSISQILIYLLIALILIASFLTFYRRNNSNLQC